MTRFKQANRAIFRPEKQPYRGKSSRYLAVITASDRSTRFTPAQPVPLFVNGKNGRFSQMDTDPETLSFMRCCAVFLTLFWLVKGQIKQGLVSLSR